jgi:hypothetical protein
MAEMSNDDLRRLFGEIDVDLPDAAWLRTDGSSLDLTRPLTCNHCKARLLAITFAMNIPPDLRRSIVEAAETLVRAYRGECPACRRPLELPPLV